MEITARAPGRVNLVGEHTDYNEGLCLPVAIPAATTAVATTTTGSVTTIRSAQADGAWSGTADDARPGAVHGWAAYAAGVLWAARAAGWAVPPLEIDLDGTLPLGGGLSSSASLEVVVAAVAMRAAGFVLDDELRAELVALCRRAESEVVGAPTGGLDQTAVVHARAGHALLLDFADGSMEHVGYDPAAAGLALVVVDTRVSHALTDGGYGSRREECEAAADRLGVGSLRHAGLEDLERLDAPLLVRRARHVVTENERVRRTVAALRDDDWRAVGGLMNASHASLRDDFEVSCAELDLVVGTAVEAGALGARMTGGGFGGSAIALVPTERVDAVRRAVDAAFAAAGFAAPGHLDGTPGDGVRVTP